MSKKTKKMKKIKNGEKKKKWVWRDDRFINSCFLILNESHRPNPSINFGISLYPPPQE